MLQNVKQQQATKQPITHPRPSCFEARVYHALMIHLDVTEPLVTVSSPDGLSFDASYVHLRSGNVEHTRTMHLSGDVKLYFVASEFPGWYYILKFSSFYQRYGCSCAIGKQGKQCEHMAAVTASQRGA